MTTFLMQVYKFQGIALYEYGFTKKLFVKKYHAFYNR